MAWGKKWLINFSAGKTWLISFDQYNNTGTIDVKLDWSLLEEKSSLHWRCLCPLNWIGALTLTLLIKLPPRKLEP